MSQAMSYKILWLIVGGFLGVVASSLLAPKLIHWYFQSPVVAFDCSPATTWAMHRLLYSQVVGAFVGLAAMGAVMFWLGKRKKNQKNGTAGH